MKNSIKTNDKVKTGTTRKKASHILQVSLDKKIIYITSIITLIIDQLIKLVIMKNMELYQEIKIIPNLFSLYYVENTGAAFSILENKTIILIVISIISLFILNKFIMSEDIPKKCYIPLGFLIGGIFGNLLDRIIHKKVIDYLSLFIFKYSFPVFNFADITITLSTLTLLIFLMFPKKNNKNTPENTSK